MDQGDYAIRWKELFDEKSSLVDKRTDLETELSEIGTRIAHLTEVLNHLAPLAGVAVGKDVSGLGITDAVRHVMENSVEPMSAGEVRDALMQRGFDFTGHSAPMSSIYKVLGRFADDPSSKIAREKAEGGRVYYRWVRDEITDDDIPF